MVVDAGTTKQVDIDRLGKHLAEYNTVKMIILYSTMVSEMTAMRTARQMADDFATHTDSSINDLTYDDHCVVVMFSRMGGGSAGDREPRNPSPNPRVGDAELVGAS